MRTKHVHVNCAMRQQVGSHKLNIVATLDCSTVFAFFSTRGNVDQMLPNLLTSLHDSWPGYDISETERVLSLLCSTARMHSNHTHAHASTKMEIS